MYFSLQTIFSGKFILGGKLSNFTKRCGSTNRGLPLLHEYFPFWMAALIGKLIILLIPILGLLYPMTRFLPRFMTG